MLASTEVLIRATPPVVNLPVNLSRSTMTGDVLEPSPKNAEDECVKDLRRALSQKLAEQDGSPGRWRSQSSNDDFLRPRQDLLDPDIGRLRDVAQPGGFRRFHVLSSSNSVAPAHAKSVLTQLLAPYVTLSDLQSSIWDEEEILGEIAKLEEFPLEEGETSNWRMAVFIAKLFFGSALLVMPMGFRNAGIIGGPLMVVMVYVMELRSMFHLIDCRDAMGPGYTYAHLGSVVYGGQSAIAALVCLSQIGFASIWIVTCQENISMLWPASTATERLWVFLPILIPLVWIRKLGVFALTNSISLSLCLLTVTYLSVYACDKISQDGPAEVRYFNTENSDWLLWLGSCAYVYEGINCTLPMYEAARDKKTFRKMLLGISFTITCVYVSFGCLYYHAFGDEVGSVATLNLPRDSFWGTVLPLGFAVVGVFTNPINLFIIFQLYEPSFPWWSEVALARKWQKNFTRTCILVVVMSLTWIGGDELQNVLGLVGGFCCSALGLIMPSVLHLVICKPGIVNRTLDLMVLATGIFILLLSTTASITSWK